MTAHTNETHTPGATILGLNARTTHELIEALGQGLPVRSVDRLASALHTPRDEVLRLTGLSARSYARRVDAGQLTPEESERVARVARVVERAYDSFGEDGGREWLNSSWPALSMRTPLEYARTDIGAQAVMDLIVAIEEGMFA